MNKIFWSIRKGKWRGNIRFQPGMSWGERKKEDESGEKKDVKRRAEVV